MDFKSLHFQSVACPRMRTLVLQTMDFQSIVVDRHYSHMISQPQDNTKIFCIADDGRCLLDYTTMKIIMQGAGLPFEEIPLEALKRMGFRNIEGGFKVHEAVFLVGVKSRLIDRPARS